MPNPIERPSLNTDLQTRYKTQRAGGAYDAKGLPTVAGTRSANGGEGFGIQEFQYTIKLFRVGSSQFLQQTDFKNSGLNLSMYVKGLNTTRYH